MAGITWQQAALALTIIITSVGTVTYTDLFGVIFNLKGMEYNYTGNITCGSECNVSINTTTSYWRYEFANYSGTKYEDKTLFKKQSRSRTLHINMDNIDNIITTQKLMLDGSWIPYNIEVDWMVPTYGHKWRPVKDGDSWERSKVNKIILMFHKNPEDTIKWSFGLEDYIDIDPILFPPYNITDNIVSVDDENIILEAYPHTLSESGYVTFNLTSKQFTGDIDVIWGFNSTVAMPKSAELYKLHNVTETKTYTCDSPYRYNYTTTPKYFWCWNDYNETITNNETNETANITKTLLIFEHDFDSAYPQNSSVAWSETHTEDYIDVHDKMNKVNFDYGGMDTWYYSKGVPIITENEYSVTAWVDVPFNQGGGKYWFCVKPSSQTLQQAISANTIYCLDPWWNSSWKYYRPIEVNVSENVTDYQILINITNKTNAQSDCSDMRFTDKYNLTEYDYWIEECNPTYDLTWVEGNFTTTNGTQIGHWYGNTTAVTSKSDGESVFPLFDDFLGSSLNASKWTWEYYGASVLTIAGSYAKIEPNSVSGRGGWIETDTEIFDVTEDFIMESKTLFYWAGTTTDQLFYHHTIANGSATIDIYATPSSRFIYSRHILSSNTDGIHRRIDFYNKDASTTTSVSINGISLTESQLYRMQTINDYSNSNWIHNISYPNRTNVYNYNYVTEKGTTIPSAVYTSITDGRLQIASGEWGGLSGGYSKTDYVFARQYITIEPTYSIGAEESSADTTKPTYSNNGHNTTVAGASVLFYIEYDDDTALHPAGQYIFSTNNTGTWTNESAVNFTATPNWANVSKTLNSTEGLTISYRWYADDNAGNINDTGIFTLTTTSADTCTYSGSGNWAILCNDNCSLVSTDLLGNNVTISGSSDTPTTGFINLYNYDLGHISGGCTVKD